MRRTTIGNRWNTPGRRYAGGWRQNPWINALCNPLHARSETADRSTASVDADSAADRRQDSSQDRQQKAAVRTWENEGGSLGIHPGMSR